MAASMLDTPMCLITSVQFIDFFFFFLSPVVSIHCCLASLTLWLYSGELGGCQPRAWRLCPMHPPVLADPAPAATSAGACRPCRSSCGFLPTICAMGLILLLFFFFFSPEDLVAWDFLSVLKWWAFFILQPAVMFLSLSEMAGNFERIHMDIIGIQSL